MSLHFFIFARLKNNKQKRNIFMMIAAKKQVGIQYIFIAICKNYVFLHAILHMLNRGSICFVVWKSVGTIFSLHRGFMYIMFYSSLSKITCITAHDLFEKSYFNY